MRVVFWDIETVAKPREQLDALLPEELKNPVLPYELANPVVPNFEHGGLKDPNKLAEWREKKVADFHAGVKSDIQKWNADIEKQKYKFYDRAALDPLTCEVKLIGLRSVEIIPPTKAKQKPKEKVATFILCAEKIDPELAREFDVVCFQNERDTLTTFWEMVHKWKTHDGGFFMCGWHTSKFDVWVTRVRSAVHRIGIPVQILSHSGYPVREIWTDLHDEYACGNRSLYASINEAAQCLGIPPKAKNGGQFGKLWETDKKAALSYLRDDDLRLTEAIGRALLGVF